MIGNSIDGSNFPHKLLLTNRQVANLCKAFASYSSTDIKLSKTQLSKIIQSGGFLGRLLGPLLKTELPLIKSLIQPLAKCVLILLELTAAAAADARIHNKILGTTTIIKSIKKMEDIIKIVQALEKSGLLLEEVSETIQNEAKKQKGGFISILLVKLGASLLGNMLAGKGIIRAGYGSKRFLIKDF